MINTMMEQNIISKSIRWSGLGEILAKIMAPIANMILARVLMPDDFGVLASINMIITFVDLFTDSGFAKYIIQSDFDSDEELYQFVNVAFWSNFVVSFVLWLLIVIFRNQVAIIVGIPGYGKVIAIASFQLLLTSFSSIQTALLKRFFNFKVLFISRIATAAVPLIITIPVAIVSRSYWALIIGSLSSAFLAALILTIKSRWKPSLYYSFHQLKKMLSFSMWSLAEAVAYWLGTWADVFIIGTTFSAYYLGIYKNSFNMVNSIMALVNASVIPVLFSSLSRLKNTQKEFAEVYFSMQRIASYFLIPMGIGLFVFRIFVTNIMFGSNWNEASTIVGVWSLASVTMLLFAGFNGEAYKAKGRPQVLFAFEITYLAVMIPVCLFMKSIGFWELVYTRGMLIIVQVIIGLFYMKKFVGFSMTKMITNVFPAIIPSLVMGIMGTFLAKKSLGLVWNLASIAICGIVYFILLFLLFKHIAKTDFNVFKNKYDMH